jgi:hypothetical protein
LPSHHVDLHDDGIRDFVGLIEVEFNGRLSLQRDQTIGCTLVHNSNASEFGSGIGDLKVPWSHGFFALHLLFFQFWAFINAGFINLAFANSDK